MIYAHYEILDLLDAVNCIEDVSTLATAMHDYPEQFPVNARGKYKNTLLLYADLFINEIN